MQVIEAQRASILEPHDHLHIGQKSEDRVGSGESATLASVRSGSDLNLAASSVGACCSAQAE